MTYSTQKICILFITFIVSFFLLTPIYAASLVPAKKSWPVRSINLEDGLPPYCTMRNTFPKANVTLIFAQDAEDNMSLAVDFTESIVEPGEEYGLTLTIPGKIHRRIVAEAVNNSVMVAQMGSDFDFLDGFARGETFRIKMSGARMTFALQGTANSVKQLEKCTYALKDVDNRVAKASTTPFKPQYKKSFVTVKKREPQPVPAPQIEAPIAEPAVTAKVETKTAIEAPKVKAVPVQDVTIEKTKAAVATEKIQEVSKTQLAISQMPPVEVPAVQDTPRVQTPVVQKMPELAILAEQKPANLPFAKKKASAVKAQAKPKPQPKHHVETMLQSALSISSVDNRKKQSGIFTWKKSDLHGNAQIFNWPKGHSFMTMVENYLMRTKSRCKSNFAFKTDAALTLSGGDVYSTGNIACIGGKADHAAALFFYGKGRNFTVISHEGPSENLHTALGMRDQISDYYLKQHSN